MSDVIVVIGAGGSVGVACVEALLRQGERILATGRDLALLQVRLAHLTSESLRLAELDVLSSAPWPAAVRACSRFIQCAGPSFRLSDRLIAKVLAHCPSPGIFIDAGGDGAAIKRWHKPLAAAGWLGIMGAGIQPGLVGVAIRVLAARFPRTDLLRLSSFAGGLQHLTPAGLAEYLQAVHARTGYPGMYWQQGEWRRVVEIPPFPACFPASARAHPYVDEEAALAAKELSLFSLCSFNVTDSAEITYLLNEIMVTGRIPDSASQRTADAVAAQSPWFCLSAEGIDEEDKADVRRTILTCVDSYQVTGAVAAWAMINVKSQSHLLPGASWFSQRPQSLAIWQQWHSQPPAGVEIVWQYPQTQMLCEEGEI